MSWRKETDKSILRNRNIICEIRAQIEKLCPYEKVTQKENREYYSCNLCGKLYRRHDIPKGTIICELVCKKK